MKIVIIKNEDLPAFEAKFEANGDYEDYEIVSVSWTGNAALFVLKEKVSA